MSALLERSDQAISATDMARNFSANMKRISSGEQDRLVVMKAAVPLAVVLPVEVFERLQQMAQANQLAG